MRRFLMVPVAAVSAPVFAAVPTEVTAAITAAGVDAGVIGASVLVVLIGIWAFKLLRRAK